MYIDMLKVCLATILELLTDDWIVTVEFVKFTDITAFCKDTVKFKNWIDDCDLNSPLVWTGNSDLLCLHCNWAHRHIEREIKRNGNCFSNKMPFLFMLVKHIELNWVLIKFKNNVLDKNYVFLSLHPDVVIGGRRLILSTSSVLKILKSQITF